MMPELTPEMYHVRDHCTEQTLTTLCRHFPDEADKLYTTLVLRSFLDVCRDNASGERLETLISLFNASVDAPVMLTRRVQ